MTDIETEHSRVVLAAVVKFIRRIVADFDAGFRTSPDEMGYVRAFIEAGLDESNREVLKQLEAWPGLLYDAFEVSACQGDPANRIRGFIPA